MTAKTRILVPGTIEKMSWRHFYLNFIVNVAAPAYLSRLAIPHMRELGGGTIVNISSGASRGPGAGPYTTVSRGGSPYGLGKAALERMTQGMAAELWEDVLRSYAQSLDEQRAYLLTASPDELADGRSWMPPPFAPPATMPPMPPELESWAQALLRETEGLVQLTADALARMPLPPQRPRRPPAFGAGAGPSKLDRSL